MAANMATNKTWCDQPPGNLFSYWTPHFTPVKNELLHLPKFEEDLFIWPKFKMAAKLHITTYIPGTYLARRLILVSYVFGVNRFIGAISLLVKDIHHDKIRFRDVLVGFLHYVNISTRLY